MPKITVLPYSDKWEKPVYRRVKYQKENRPPINAEDRIISKISCTPNKSRNIYTPTGENEMGKVWTF